MVTVRYNLYKPSDDETLIYLVLYAGFKDKIRLSTKIKIKPKNWNERHQRVKNIASVKHSKTINHYLDNLEEKIRLAYIKLQDNGKLSKDSLTVAAKELLNSKTLKGKSELFDFFEGFLKNNPDAGRQYKTTYLKLHEFNSSLTFRDINTEFYLKFVELQEKKGYSKNYIGTLVKCIKSIMNKSLHIHGNDEFKKFKKTAEEVYNVYLTQKELIQMYEFKFDNERLSKARDIFLIGAWTGLRFQDYTNISPNEIKNGIITKKTTKTKEVVSIPIRPELDKLLQKYDYTSPTMSNQKLNEYIKEVGEKLGFDEVVHKSRTQGVNGYVTKEFKKHELITTHTARRSFATNAFLAGVPVISIMKITGHRTQQAFMKYIKVTSLENAIKLQEHSFFN